MIVGFPGETEEEFEETTEFLKKVAFYETHIFKYSRRKGTRADRMPEQVLEQVKTKRSEILLKLDKEHREMFEEKLNGKTVEVLFEERIIIEGKPYFVGHTKEYVKVAVETKEDLTNRLCQVVITGKKIADLCEAENLP